MPARICNDTHRPVSINVRAQLDHRVDIRYSREKVDTVQHLGEGALKVLHQVRGDQDLGAALAV